jgi:hypothetical protein
MDVTSAFSADRSNGFWSTCGWLASTVPGAASETASPVHQVKRAAIGGRLDIKMRSTSCPEAIGRWISTWGNGSSRTAGREKRTGVRG